MNNLFQNDSGFKNSNLKLILSICIFASIVILGSFGYVLIENWSWADAFYMTIVTVSTVGFGETHPLSGAGRVFTSLLIVFGVGTMAYMIANIGECVFQRQLMLFSPTIKMNRIISKMKNHIIICGCGKMGMATVNELLDDDMKNIVLIDNDQDKIAGVEHYDLPYIVGDATLEHVLEKAGISTARSLVATLDNDAENLFLVLTARSLNPDLMIIARAESDVNRKKLIQAGASKTVSPYAAGAQRVYSLLTSPGINDLGDALQGDRNVKFKMDILEIEEEDQFAGKNLVEARLREVLGGLVVAIRRKDDSMLFNPQPSTIMNPGDSLYIMKFFEKEV